MAKVLDATKGFSQEHIRALADAVRACALVAFPTDTVYGIGSNAVVRAAVRRIYDAKQRQEAKPLPTLLASVDAASEWVEWTQQARRLAAAFWPGALTLVLKPTAQGRKLTFAEYKTIAVRVPAEPPLLEAIKLSGVPWAATSANLSGRPALNEPGKILEELGGHLDLFVDGGSRPWRESTVVDASGAAVRVLREGAIPAADILRAAAGRP